MGAGAPLAERERAYFEPRFGRDFSQVRLHSGGAAHRAARFLGARAFTRGRDIAFADGEYRPDLSDGRRLIAHELAHILQQERGASDTIQREQACCASGDQCAEPDGLTKANSKPSITLYADKEGPFLLIPVTSRVGHAWLRLEDGKGKHWSFGFWPSKGFDPKHPSKDVEGCVCHPDKRHKPTSSQTFILEQSDFDDVFDYVTTVCRDRPKYNLFDRNCTTFVRDALAWAGQGSFGGFGLIWENPNALDSWMRVHSLEIGAAATVPTAGTATGAAPAVSYDIAYRQQFFATLGNKLRLYGYGSAQLGPTVKAGGGGLGTSLDLQKVWLPSAYLEGGVLGGAINPLTSGSPLGIGGSAAVGLRFNIDAFGSVGVEYNIIKNFANDDPAFGRLMIKAGITLW